MESTKAMHNNSSTSECRTLHDTIKANNPEVRSIKIARKESGYGFTLSRIFLTSTEEAQLKKIIKQNNSSTNSLLAQANETERILAETKANDGQKSNQTEIIFVKHVKEGGASYIAGLREGDCPLSIDSVSIGDKPYSSVVQLIEKSGDFLELTVVPSFIQTSGLSSKAFTTTNAINKSLAQQPKKASVQKAMPIVQQQAGQNNALNSTSNSTFSKQNNSSNLSTPLGSPDTPQAKPLIEIGKNIATTSSLKVFEIKNEPSKLQPENRKKSVSELLKPEASKLIVPPPTESNKPPSTTKSSINSQKSASQLGTGVGALLYSYLNVPKIEKNTVNQFNINSPRMSNIKQNQQSQSSNNDKLSGDEKKQKKTTPNFKFLDSSAFSAFSKDKLKNLQDALSKHYTNEQLNQLGIIVNKNATIVAPLPRYPETDSKLISSRNQENLYKPIETDNYYRNQYAFSRQIPSPQQVTTQSNHQPQQNLLINAHTKYQSPASSPYSPGSSITGHPYPTSYSKIKSTNNSSQNESAMLNAVAAAAAAVNKNSPQLFSKYIESVHKAMHGGIQDSNSNEGDGSNNTGDPYNVANHTKFVEHCRQLFDNQKSPTKASKLASIGGKSINNEDYGYSQNDNQRLNPAQSAFFYNTYSRQNMPQTKVDSASSLPVYPTYNKNLQEKLDNTQLVNHQQNIRASSLGFDLNNHQNVSGSNTSFANAYNNQQHPQLQQSHFQPKYSSNFNHFNRASYKGECKRLMSRTNMESVAERASRFEEIDFERYNRLKAKYGELDLSQQYETDFANQLQLQRYLKLNESKNRNNNNYNNNGNHANYVMEPLDIKTMPTNLNEHRQSTSNYSPHNQINSASQVVDSMVADYLQRTRKLSQMNQQSMQDDTSKYCSVGSSILNNTQSNNNVKPNLVNNPNTNNKMLSNFVGGISSTPGFQQSFMDGLKQQQQQQQNQQIIEDDMFEKKYKSRSTTSSSPNRYSNLEYKAIRNARPSNEFGNQSQQFPNRTRQSKSSQSTKRNSESKTAKGMLHYNFSNYNPSGNLNSYIMSSDAGESTSTDSDIGTSPSATTIASPPSSPQQQVPPNNNNKNNQRLNPSHSNYDNNNQNLKMNYQNQNKAQGPNNSIIRQHSYLHAVQLNDFKIAHPKKNNNFSAINENEVGPFLTDPHNITEPLTTPYYYSPSSTVMRQQRLLKQQYQQQQPQQVRNMPVPKARSKSSVQPKKSFSQDGIDIDEYNPSLNLRHIDSVTSSPLTLNNNYQNGTTKPSLMERSNDTTTTPNLSNDDTDEMRRLSYLTSNRKHMMPNNETLRNNENVMKNSHNSKVISSQTPQHSRNTSIKKLKNFFGEKTPVVLQAVENKNIIASDDFLATLLETIKEGVLNCKIVCKDGKRSTDRSWRPAWAVLKKSGALFLCKEKKDNIMIPSTDSYPIDLKHSVIQVAYEYTKRKNVFKVNTFSNSEYLFQTCDNDSMMEWIREMQDNSTPPDLNKLFSSHNSVPVIKYTDDLNKSQNHHFNQSNGNNNYSSAAKIGQNWDNNNLSMNTLSDQMNMSGSLESSKLKHTHMSYSSNVYNKSMNNSSEMIIASSPEDMFSNQSQISNNNNMNENMSPIHLRKAEDNMSPRRDNSNRKWVRQMTKRLKDFMTSTNTSDISSDMQSQNQQQSNDFTNSRNFGVSLDKCESSSISQYIPVAVEICTRLIELHINDEGIYRKVGQKQVVTALRAQLSRGILNIDVSDYNWDNPHAVVSLLKCFLNELPDSLSTSQYYNEFIQMSKITNHHNRLVGIKKLLHRLSMYNFETLKYLTAHLRRVAAAYQHNKMTIKNICIAFSQSIIRHNEANCETIKADHLNQSLLIELMLVYHDWLFEPNNIDMNAPDEVKDVCESQLFQQFCTYQEPILYSDLLLNIMKSIRSRWNSTITSMNSHTSNTLTDGFANSHTSNSSHEIDYSHNTTVPRPINIQFRSKQTVFRSFKSAGALGQITNRKAEKSKSKNSNFMKKDKAVQQKEKNRSRSVDAKTFEAPATQKKNILKTLVRNSNHRSYTDLNKTPVTNNQIVVSTPNDTAYEKDLNEVLNNQFIDFKILEEKNEQERKKLNKMMQKLEVDLMNAKIDLMGEENYVKPTPTDSLYTTKYCSSQVISNSTLAKSKEPTNIYNKTSLSNSYMSTISNSTSGIIATTAPSSSSSSVSTSSPLNSQHKIIIEPSELRQENSLNRKSNDPKIETKNIRLLLINKPRRLPRRRHTIASRNECSIRNLSSLPVVATFTSSSDFSLSDNEEDDFELGDSTNKIIRSYTNGAIKRKTYKRKNSLTKLTSKSITDFGHVDKSEWVGRRTKNQKSIEMFSHTDTSASGLSENKIVLNLSPLSLSASSITTSSISDDEEKCESDSYSKSCFSTNNNQNNETLKYNQKNTAFNNNIKIDTNAENANNSISDSNMIENNPILLEPYANNMSMYESLL